MHQVKGAGLNKFINSYNSANAGKPTPAGQALVSAGLLSLADLTALNGVQQQIALAPTTPVNNSAFRAFDVNVGYPVHLSRLREGMTLEPKVAMYNVFNMSNFSSNGLTGQLLNVTDAGGTVGSTNNYLNGPNDTAVENGIRTQRGSGTFAQGSPRTTEFQLRLAF
jgi:hypothetical protein